jgi:hypothetical protein
MEPKKNETKKEVTSVKNEEIQEKVTSAKNESQKVENQEVKNQEPGTHLNENEEEINHSDSDCFEIGTEFIIEESTKEAMRKEKTEEKTKKILNTQHENFREDLYFNELLKLNGYIVKKMTVSDDGFFALCEITNKSKEINNCKKRNIGKNRVQISVSFINFKKLQKKQV